MRCNHFHQLCSSVQCIRDKSRDSCYICHSVDISIVDIPVHNVCHLEHEDIQDNRLLLVQYMIAYIRNDIDHNALCHPLGIDSVHFDKI